MNNIHILRTWRQANDMKQTEVAAAVGMSHQLISRIERGEIRPSMPTAKRISAVTCGALTWYEIMAGSREDAA